ncbi:unnamed protein product [Paramecium octaurelia]|uniref:Uncharacterized protein n=1 Tax=Paramecium octaurelia TaxID=43137 RepID=A0A8S1VPZ7_PAROT|nr:unnamed protein product [Paramecium octaurelia]
MHLEVHPQNSNYRQNQAGLQSRRENTSKLSQHQSPIIPICLKQSTNRENEVPQEFDGEKSIYKSFIDEYYSVRSNFPNSPSVKFQKKKIFDDVQIPSQKTSQIATRQILNEKSQTNNQEIYHTYQQLSERDATLIQQHPYFENQIKSLQIDTQHQFKLECLKDSSKENLIVFKNKQILITLKRVSLKKNILNCELTFQNIGTAPISVLDVLYSNDQTLRLSKENDCIKSLTPGYGQMSTITVEIVNVPFTIVSVSLEYNNQFFKTYLPITILSFIQDYQTTQSRCFNNHTHYNRLIISKKNWSIESKIIIGNILNSEVEIRVENQNNQLVLYCQSDLEQLNWQILNTLYVLFDL